MECHGTFVKVMVKVKCRTDQNLDQFKEFFQGG
jgi:hypothetical protein